MSLPRSRQVEKEMVEVCEMCNKKKKGTLFARIDDVVFLCNDCWESLGVKRGR